MSTSRRSRRLSDSKRRPSARWPTARRWQRCLRTRRARCSSIARSTQPLPGLSSLKRSRFRSRNLAAVRRPLPDRAACGGHQKVMSTKELRTMKVTVKPLAAHIGVEIQGLDLAAPISDEDFDSVRKAFYDYAVIVVRGGPFSAD